MKTNCNFQRLKSSGSLNQQTIHGGVWQISGKTNREKGAANDESTLR